MVLPVSKHVPAIKELNLATSGGFGAVDNEQLLNWKLTYNTYCATDETQSIAGTSTMQPLRAQSRAVPHSPA